MIGDDAMIGYAILTKIIQYEWGDKNERNTDKEGQHLAALKIII